MIKRIIKMPFYFILGSSAIVMAAILGLITLFKF